MSVGLCWFGGLFTLIQTLEIVTVSVTHWFFFLYSFPVYLPEVSSFKSQSSSSFLLCKNKKQLKNNKKTPFSFLLMKGMQSERQQTAAPWDFVLTGQLTNPYSPGRLSKCYLLFSCVDKQLRSTRASATTGESGQGPVGVWQDCWQGQQKWGSRILKDT